VGLAGAEAAKKGWFWWWRWWWWWLKDDAMEALTMESHVGIGLGFLEVGEDKGGVTGALFDILRGGREAENECRI